MGSISVEDELEEKGSASDESDEITLTVQSLGLQATNNISWQCERLNLLDRGQFLLDNNEALSDVVFVVGKGIIQQEIPAHRFLLAMGSPVFETMFYGPTRQIADGSDIPLPDIEPAAFRNLLRFIYTDDVSGIDDDTILPTLYAAKKYVIPQLKTACLNFMRRNIRAENVFVLLEQAQQSEEHALVQQCLDLIDKQTYAVISTEGFLETDHDTLRRVLQRDGLSVREVELLNALNRWAERECLRQDLETDSPSKRKIVGAAFFDLRFPLMSVEELANGPVQSGLLTATETRDLFLHFFARVKPELPFSTTPRQGACGEEYTVTRFTDINGSWGYGGGADSIQFSVDKDIAMVGCGLYGCRDGPGNHKVTVEVVSSVSKKVIVHQETELQSDGSQSIFRTMFREPVVIQAGVPHVVSVSLEGPASHRGVSGSSRISTVPAGATETACTFVFCDSSESGNGTSVSDGQIPSLYFCLL